MKDLLKFMNLDEETTKPVKEKQSVINQNLKIVFISKNSSRNDTEFKTNL